MYFYMFPAKPGMVRVPAVYLPLYKYSTTNLSPSFRTSFFYCVAAFVLDVQFPLGFKSQDITVGFRKIFVAWESEFIADDEIL